MTKQLIIVSVLLLLLTPFTTTHAEQGYFQPAERSKEELVMDMFFSLLLPDIQTAVTNYYSDYLTENPLVYPYQIDIVHMDRVNGYRGFVFSVTVEVSPVVGPHISVGKDRLTFRVTPSEVKLTNYKHIETYELPPNWQDIQKKKETGE